MAVAAAAAAAIAAAAAAAGADGRKAAGGEASESPGSVGGGLYGELHGWISEGELRVSPEDWLLYDRRAFLAAEKARRRQRRQMWPRKQEDKSGLDDEEAFEDPEEEAELQTFWEARCIPAEDHPTTAFAIRHLGLCGAGSNPAGCSRYVLANVPAPMAARIPPGEEARFDPHDDTCYTLEQLSRRYAREYPKEEIANYWVGLPPWWRPAEFGCVSRDHFSLHRNLCLLGILRSGRVLDAVLQTDRIYYSPDPLLAYCETAQEFGSDATLSSPRIHVCCVEAIADACAPGAKVLDVGCGTGFVTAVLARLVGPSGRVLGLDVKEEYVDLTLANIRRDDQRLLETRSGQHAIVEARLGDGWFGAEDDGPFDAIHVACSVPTVPPALLQQLKEGGRLLLPVGPPTPQWQNLTVITKRQDGGFDAKVIRPVRYVTMVHPPPMLRDRPRACERGEVTSLGTAHMDYEVVD